MPSPKAPPLVYRLRIRLIGIDPPIWRMLQVPSSIKLCCLHSAFQVVMGWKDNHLHEFEKDGERWGIVQLYEDEERDVANDSDVTLADVLKSEGDSLIYVYDFGDHWRHEVVLEKSFSAEGAAGRPVCLGGERALPAGGCGRRLRL